jgi:hypothetical protein
VCFFEAAGGVPKVGRTDRMGALGVSQGKRFRLHPPTIEFARHHGIEIRACQAGDAKRKGKSERPFRDLKESFLTEFDALGAPEGIAELNQRAGLWLNARVHARAHATTGEAPGARLDIERRFLASLPHRRFDTAYADDRRVHPRLPLVECGNVKHFWPHCDGLIWLHPMARCGSSVVATVTRSGLTVVTVGSVGSVGVSFLVGMWRVVAAARCWRGVLGCGLPRRQVRAAAPFLAPRLARRR